MQRLNSIVLLALSYAMLPAAATAFAASPARVGRASIPLDRRASMTAAASDDGVTITAAGLSDLEQALNLTMYVFFGQVGNNPGFNNNRAAAFEQLADEQSTSLTNILDDSLAVSFKAVLDEEMVGFVTCSGSGVLTNLAVHPKARRRRLGTALVQRLLAGVGEAAREDGSGDRGRDRARVMLEVDWDNAPAFELYKALGFETMVANEPKTGTRYKVDWWRGRVREEVFKIAMRAEVA